MRTVELGEEGSFDATAVGHKAANLARFAATFRVPPAFCLSSSVHEELKRALEPAGDAERAALRECVAEAYERLAARIGVREPRVAVRSSATAEDSADASFAGQHETFLNVRGIEAVVDAVLDCWRSADSERAQAYRRERRITGQPSVAVLVQQMVDADVAAIAFGVDPVSGDTTVVVIDAARGLGDAIASGEVTPDRYAVRKDDLSLVVRNGDTLNTDAAIEIAKLVLALERHNGHAVDVECAYARGELYLLQCRPVTTLPVSFPVEWRHARDAKLHWRRDDAHSGAPEPRLLTDYTEYGPTRGLQRRAEMFDLPLRPRLEGFKGRIYTTAEPRVKGDVVELARASVPRVRAYGRDGRRRWDEEQLPALHAHYRWYEELTVAAATLSRVELATAWVEAWQRVGDVWFIHMLAVWSGFAAGDELSEFYEHVVGGPSIDALKLTQGYAPTLQQLERDLHELARLRAANDPRFAEALSAFLASPHGNLGSSGEDMRDPVWRDDPELLLAALDRRAANADDPEARHRRLIDEGLALERRVRETLRDRPDDLARFDAVLGVARAVAPLTEEHNYHLDRQMQAIMRRLLLAVGARMTADEQLRAKEDIYWFHVTEICDALRDGRDLRSCAGEREVEFAAWRRLRHPKTLGGPPGPLHALSSRTDLNFRSAQDAAAAGVLKGVAASPGLRRGRACLVRGAADFGKLKPGDVLVCRASNVSWVPLFTLAAAVVTDVGGALCHAAVVAREFGVPAVVGTGSALETFRDGQLIEVDGDGGTVRALD